MNENVKNNHNESFELIETQGKLTWNTHTSSQSCSLLLMFGVGGGRGAGSSPPRPRRFRPRSARYDHRPAQ